MALSDKIVQTGLSYVGQQEISGNKGFKNAAFQKKMEECGWSMTQSWSVS